MGRAIASALTLALLAVGCGVLPGTDNGDSVDTGGQVPTTPLTFPTPRPTATPTPIPTPTSRPTATPQPTPTPTPSVGDSYADLLSQVREVFSADDKEAAIGDLVPLPMPLEIPDDADFAQLEVAYAQWDVWTAITNAFPPVDLPADVTIDIAFSTGSDIDALRDSYVGTLVDLGFEIVNENVQSGQFADVSLELNGGAFTRGRGGTARFNGLRQGDSNFVQFEIDVELEQDTSPPLIEWPAIFAIPFPGDFTEFSATAVAGPDGIEVSATAQWIIGLRAVDIRGIIETLIEEYPTDTVSVSGTITQTNPSSPAVTTFSHPTGSGGSIAAFSSPDGTIIDILAVSLPG